MANQFKMPTIGGGKKNNVLTMSLYIFIVAVLVTGMWSGYTKVVRPWIASSTGAEFLVDETEEARKEQAEEAGITEDDVKSCSGVQSVNLLYNDKDMYKIGTDPSANVTIYDPIAKNIHDDATSSTVPILTDFKGLSANMNGVPDGNYFGKEITFTSGCSDLDSQPKLAKAGAPTLTVVNDNGVSVNSPSNVEAMDASSSYTPCITVKAPAEQSSSEYGAFFIFEYDATYVNKISSTDLDDKSTTVLLTHTTNHSYTNNNFDQFKTMFWDMELRDGDKEEVCFTVETTSSTPGANQSNVEIHYYPVNKDLDADDFNIIEDIYDEDNNLISLGNKSLIYHSG